jgi:hypothetical protein
MKRALGFVNAPTTNKITTTLHDITSQELQILDDNGNAIPLEVEATRLLYSDGWNIVQEGSVKGADNSWHKNDIKYEILLDMFGGIITDSSNEPIFVL